MLKTLVIATAISGLMASNALAQSSNPAANAPAKSDEIQTNAAAGSKFVTAQTSDQWLASKFIGTDVIGPDSAKVGDVSDVLFDKSGKALAYVVGVGEFLGIGKKDVALEPASFDWIAATETADAKLKLAMTKDELKAAPDFKPYQPPRATVGLGGGTGGMNRPAPAGSPSALSPMAPANPPAQGR